MGVLEEVVELIVDETAERLVGALTWPEGLEAKLVGMMHTSEALSHVAFGIGRRHTVGHGRFVRRDGSWWEGPVSLSDGEPTLQTVGGYVVSILPEERLERAFAKDRWVYYETVVT